MKIHKGELLKDNALGKNDFIVYWCVLSQSFALSHCTTKAKLMLRRGIRSIVLILSRKNRDFLYLSLKYPLMNFLRVLFGCLEVQLNVFQHLETKLLRKSWTGKQYKNIYSRHNFIVVVKSYLFNLKVLQVLR